MDLYPIRNCKLCPSASLLKLRKLAIAEGVWKPEWPVFSFKSGKFLTKQDVNLWLGKLLSDFTDNEHVFTGHSFRAAIPSILASHPDEHRISNIQEWGGWSSDCYKIYTKNESDKRRTLFYEIVNCIMLDEN